jgi:hypothetical protein
MPFEKGHKLWKAGLKTKKEKGDKLDAFLLMLADNGIDAYGDLMNKLVNAEPLTKSQQEYMDRFEGWREYIKPKLERKEIDTKVSGGLEIYKWKE